MSCRTVVYFLLGVVSAISILLETTAIEAATLALDLGIDANTGVAVEEDAVKEKLTASLSFGAGISGGLSITPFNLVRLRIGYLRPLNTTEAGSEQVRVRTAGQLIDILAIYERRFAYIALLAGLGPSLKIVTTRLRLYDLDNPVISSDQHVEGGQYLFPEKEKVFESRERGIELGAMIAMGMVVDLGRLIGIEPHFFSTTLQVQYVRRGYRNELYGWFGITISPTSILK